VNMFLDMHPCYLVLWGRLSLYTVLILSHNYHLLPPTATPLYMWTFDCDK